MQLFEHVRGRRWSTVFGYVLFVAVVGLGAVLNTYFGFQSFEPVTIPGGSE